jgi:hypothetical protein
MNSLYAIVLISIFAALVPVSNGQTFNSTEVNVTESYNNIHNLDFGDIVSGPLIALVDAQVLKKLLYCKIILIILFNRPQQQR